jgi:xylulokinase
VNSYTLGIDIGTTGTKMVLLEIGVGVIAAASRPCDLHSGQPGFSEADPSQWLENIYSGVQELLTSSAIDPHQVVGISTSGMVPAVIAVDKNFQPLRKAILQNDARASEQIAELSKALVDVDCVADTGSALSQQSVAPTLMWLRTNEPDLWAATAHILGSYDWVLVALGATPHLEQNWALESGLFYIDGTPHETIRDAAGIPASVIPDVEKAGACVGYLSEKAASAMGLPAATPLYVGGADHVLSAYGAGVANEGDWLIKLGGAGDILVSSATPMVDSRLYLDAHPVPGAWLPNGCMATSGSLIRWFQALVGVDDLQLLDQEARESKPGEILCLPYFLGEKSPLHDPDLRGVFFGMHLGTTRGDMYRAVLEAIAFGFRQHVDVFRELGVPLTRAMVTNGGSKSTLWVQIHADILGVDLHPVVDHPGASLGAAVIAGVGASQIDGFERISDYVTLGPSVEPRLEVHHTYELAYHQWRELSDVTTPLAHQLSERTRR